MPTERGLRAAHVAAHLTMAHAMINDLRTRDPAGTMLAHDEMRECAIRCDHLSRTLTLVALDDWCQPPDVALANRIHDHTTEQQRITLNARWAKLKSEPKPAQRATPLDRDNTPR